MALAFAVLLFFGVSGSITLFGYRRYARAGRVYENLAVEPGPMPFPAVPPDSRFFTVIRFVERVGRKLPPSAANATRFRRELLACGFRYPNAVAVFFGIKLLLAGALLILALLFQFRPSLPHATRLIAILGAALAGYSLPDLLLKRRIQRSAQGAAGRAGSHGGVRGGGPRARSFFSHGHAATRDRPS
jgi:hypothetical protein